MPLTHILILAVVQGLAEFLPISSSGHLVVTEELLEQIDGKPIQDKVDVNIVLHAGTLMSILVYYWDRIWRLLFEDRRTILLLIIATLPAVVVGIPVKKWADAALLTNPLLTGVLLVVTGAMLFAVSRFPPQNGTYTSLSYRKSLWIGVSQALAILPGLSRSGATISAGLAGGLSRRDAATFAFLMAIPAIAGAGVLQLGDLLVESGPTTSIGHLLIGAVVAFLVGLISLKWLVGWLEKGRLEYFGYWCIPLGLVVIAWQLLF